MVPSRASSRTRRDSLRRSVAQLKRDVNLLEGLLPSSFLVEGLKTAMMFIHDRLLRIQHETIDGCHRCLPFVRSRQHGNRPYISTAMIRMGG